MTISKDEQSQQTYKYSSMHFIFIRKKTAKTGEILAATQMTVARNSV
jgi:hypothetical protein